MTNDFPIASEDDTNTKQDSELNEVSNKFKYEEFAGPQGKRLLHNIVKQILPSALYDQWRSSVSYQVDGNKCYVGGQRMQSDMALVINMHERTIRWRWQQLRQYGLVEFEPGFAEFQQDDGTSQIVPVTNKVFDALYDLAYEFLRWRRSPNYFPPTRENAAIILQTNTELAEWLCRFYCYRKVFLYKKPGPKPQERPSYKCIIEQKVAAARQAVLASNEVHREKGNTFSNSFAINFAANTNSPNQNFLEKRDTNSLLGEETRSTIGNDTDQSQRDSRPTKEGTNSPPLPSQYNETRETNTRKDEKCEARTAERQNEQKEREAAQLGLDIDFGQIREVMTELSERYNNAPALESNMTQVRRLIELRGRHISQQEIIEKIHRAAVATGKKDDDFFHYRDEEGRPVKMPYFFKIFRVLMLPGSHVYRRAQRAAKPRQEAPQTPLPVLLEEQEPVMEYAPPVAPERPRAPRSQAEKQRREEYARKKKGKLVLLGVLCPSVEQEHRCGCPVYSEHRGKRTCAWCENPAWHPDAMQLLRDIMEQ